MEHQKNNQNSRRQFLKMGTLLGAAAITAPIISCSQPEKKVLTNDLKDSSKSMITKTRTLGTGENSMKVSALGLG